MPLNNPQYLTLVEKSRLLHHDDHLCPDNVSSLPDNLHHNLRNRCLLGTRRPPLALHIRHRWAPRLHQRVLQPSPPRNDAPRELYFWSVDEYRSSSVVFHFLHSVQTGEINIIIISIIILIIFRNRQGKKLLNWVHHGKTFLLSGGWVLPKPPQQTVIEKTEYNINLARLSGGSGSEVRWWGLTRDNDHLSSMVGNFQETQVVLVHFVGASLAFGLGTLYLWVQASGTLSNCRENDNPSARSTWQSRCPPEPLRDWSPGWELS